MSSILSHHQQNNTNPDIDLLMAMHRYKRPKGSRTEQAFIEAFLTPLGVKDDAYGNLHLSIGDNPTTLFSSHTDTVHTSDGMQQIVLNNNILTLKKKSPSNCLGADDGAGVWIMMEMIKARIPGMYIFHYGEEKGCEGSEAIAKNTPEILKNIKAAIAFDRKGFGDVITFMGGTRVCSEDFAKSLILQLPQGYKPDNGGMRTDVKLYEKLVEECTNISVGYSGQHMSSETLNIRHLFEVRDAMLKFDESKLVIKRDPAVVENKSYTTNNTSRPAGTLNSNGRTTYAPVGHYYASTVADICERQHRLIAKMMIRAGVTFDQLLHLMMEEQVHQTEPKSYQMPLAIPPDNWIDPYAPPKEEKKDEPAAATTATPSTPAATPSGGNVQTNVSDAPASAAKDVSPHHISNPGASDIVRGGGSPLRTGNPHADGIAGQQQRQHS